MNFIEQNFNTLIYAWIGLAAGVFVLLFFIPAPYGRHVRKGWGPMIPARWAWLFMEFTSLLVMLLSLFFARHRDPVAFVLALMWIGHYVYRSLIFPFLLNKNSHAMPVSVVFMSVIFNVVNAGTNGLYLFFVGPEFPNGYWGNKLFLLGILMFVTGFIIHFLSDRHLRNLRSSGDSGYKIPRKGLFEFVSCPNYLGELIEWSGWALAAFNLPALAFVVWTAANLVPRAVANHQWYKSYFPDDPKQRKAIIPFVL